VSFVTEPSRVVFGISLTEGPTPQQHRPGVPNGRETRWGRSVMVLPIIVSHKSTVSWYLVKLAILELNFHTSRWYSQVFAGVRWLERHRGKVSGR
jgi:hypothetical protein